MAVIRFNSFQVKSSTIELGLTTKARVGKLNHNYFILSDNLGNEASVERASFVNDRQVELILPEAFKNSSSFMIRYQPPQKDQKNGVIQTRSGKDAGYQDYQYQAQSPSPKPATDPLTNAWIYNGHTYNLVKQPKTWNEALDDARTRAGYLAQIDTISENNAVYSEIRQRLSQADLDQTRSRLAGGGASYVWLGGTDAELEGTWIWANSSERVPSDAPPWGTGGLGREPDNLGDQDGLAMGLEAWPVQVPSGDGFGRAGQWNDQAIDERYYYLIEWSTELPLSLFGS
jgi:hypothetical protein